MIKTIASFFTKKDEPQAPTSKIILKKSDIDNRDEIDAANKHIFDERSHRLPGFPEGIPVVSIDLLIHQNDEMIKQIILTRGMAGSHNKLEVETKIMSPIRHLAAMTHLLPASDKDHFKLPGGLFAYCLETALFSIRYAERRILTRATPEIRKEEESLWAHAAFLAGLFREAITAIAKMSIYADRIGIEWNPSMEPLHEWLLKNNVERYHIRWRSEEEKAVIVILASKAIQDAQSRILIKGESAIYNTLILALNARKDEKNPMAEINEHRNPITDIVNKVSYKIQQREVWSDADRYGKPLTGMKLEPWLIDAMRHLLQKKRWVANDANGRIWHGQDGVFLVWPLAANDMQFELKAGECPFLPNTHEILAEIMLDAGIIERNRLGGYLFDIAVPNAESAEKTPVEALKFAHYETLFTKTQHKPIDENLQIKIDDHEDSDDDESTNKTGDEKSQLTSDRIVINKNRAPSVHSETAQTQFPESPSKTNNNDQDTGSGFYEATEYTMQSLKSDEEPVDINILFGKPAEPVAKQKNEVQNKPRKEDPDIEAIFNDASVSTTANQYDNDYTADYYAAEKSGYPDISPLSEGDKDHNWVDSTTEKKDKSPLEPTIDSGKQEIKQSPEQSEQTPSVQKETVPEKAKKKVDKIAENPKPEAPEPVQKTKPFDGKDNQSSAHQTNPRESPKPSAGDANPDEDLLGALIGSVKSRLSSDSEKDKEAPKTKVTERGGLFGKVETSSNAQSGRAVLILNRLKRLPAKYLEARPGGITKVIAMGLKETQLDLKECVPVLKSAGLLALVDGYETGLGSADKPKSRYFLVKADLLDGK